MDNYRIQNGCHNCRHAHSVGEAGLDCTLGAPPEPEQPMRFDEAAYDKYFDWEYQLPTVHPSGICDHWEESE